MSRIANLASTNALVSRLMQTQSKVNDLQIQATTEKVSQTYQGIARDSQRLVNIENSRNMLSNFVATNEAADLRLKTMESVVTGIRKTIIDFRESLFEFETSTAGEEQRTKDIQDAAFRALTDMNVYLNTDVDGRFMFAGGRVTTQPVDLGLSTIGAFQARYDGESTVYPPTRDAHVETNVALTATDTGGLDFDFATGTITANNAGSLAGIPEGSLITISNSGSNDGTYTVVSNDNDTITIAGNLTIPPSTIAVTGSVVDELDAPATISVSSYYKGDTVSQTQRVDQSREFTLDLNAIDPTFEKAIRAMGLIAQGAYGTSGGLENHPERFDQAIYLITSSLEITAAGTPPFGPESRNNISQVQQNMGYQRILIDQTNKQHETLIGFFDQNVIETENVNTTEIVARLLDETRALELAYQAIARIQQLSLGKFLG
ncbi:MAG: hypothetical protein RBS99_00575 [Rhodospirillales bacterium]|jgi:flagellin-like hook-associated protein FlgL|nr:hypothetical protein [Rhodospirillales bacterium]